MYQHILWLTDGQFSVVSATASGVLVALHDKQFFTSRPMNVISIASLIPTLLYIPLVITNLLATVLICWKAWYASNY